MMHSTSKIKIDSCSVLMKNVLQRLHAHCPSLVATSSKDCISPSREPWEPHHKGGKRWLTLATCERQVNQANEAWPPPRCHSLLDYFDKFPFLHGSRVSRCVVSTDGGPNDTNGPSGDVSPFRRGRGLQRNRRQGPQSEENVCKRDLNNSTFMRTHGNPAYSANIISLLALMGFHPITKLN